MLQRAVPRPRRAIGRVLLACVCAAALVVSGISVAGAVGPSALARCKRPFVGTVDRAAETGGSSPQPAASRSTSDFRSAVVYDFGSTKNLIVYVGDYAIKRKELGGTIEAPDGKVLVTLFLRRSDGKNLRAGQRLVAGEDSVGVVIDAGAGARAVTTGRSGAVELLTVSDDRLCFRIAYADTFQTVDGIVSAAIP